MGISSNLRITILSNGLQKPKYVFSFRIVGVGTGCKELRTPAAIAPADRLPGV
jgi:hypothetical protein